MSLLSCPNEVLCNIFSSNIIALFDLSNLMLTCRRFHDVIRNSNELWKLKFTKRWPRIPSHLVKRMDEIDPLSVVSLRYKVGKEVREALKDMSHICYPVGQPTLATMNNLIDRESPVPEFIESELLELIFEQPNVNENLTSRYYANKVLRYLRSSRLEKEWKDLMSLPEDEKSLLAGSVMVSQWAQMEENHTVSLSEVQNFIGQVAERVIQLITRTRGSVEARTDDPRCVRMMLNCINQVLYEDLGFQGNMEDYYAPENSYIEKVLQTRRGIPITLCIVYHEVAKKLGIQCEPVSFPQHFLLRWQEHPEKDGADRFTYIDAFNGGSSHPPRSCPLQFGQPRPQIRREAFAAVPAEHVFQRMVNNLIQCTRVHEESRRNDHRLQNKLQRLACAISPGQTPLVVAYAELCVFLGYQLEEAIKLLQAEGFTDDHNLDYEPNHWTRVRQITLEKCVRKLSEQQAQIDMGVVRRRLPSIKYAVGLIMRHSHSDLGGRTVQKYTCVIASWDPKCQASSEWMKRLAAHSLGRGADQPFYQILIDGGSSHYVAEDSLELVSASSVINHPDIGLFFERFDGKRYVPNSETMANYPDDETAALSLITTIG